ncbi:MAG TPA: polysaccharide biosynthesis C-terminal domain-containing protein [Chitinophagaceae bacterium]
MSGIRKLAGQTLWYGVPTIATRFLGYATNIFLFWLYAPVSTAFITQVYALIPFLNILYTYGLETSYFRFVQTADSRRLYSTLMVSMLVTTAVFSFLFYFFAPQIADAVEMKEHPEYIRWVAWILFFDTLSVLPFAKLRQEGRPRRYAFVKVIGILVNVAFIIFFIGVCPAVLEKNPGSPLAGVYDPRIGIGYYIIANIIGSIVTLLLLLKEFRFRFEFDTKLWKEVMKYSWPLIIVGFGGMINEMLSRVIYLRVVDLPREEALRQLGIFGANYKLAVLITLFIQVFRLGAEPFFFNQSKDKQAPSIYARVMKFFVIICCLMWLLIATNLSIIQYIGYGANAKAYGEGLRVIPVLAMASVFLGIYYNLTVWYKLTNRTLAGAWITLAGAAITIILNIWWIPVWGYVGSAWATFTCYAFMMVISYVLGQKYYPIPYHWKKLMAYIATVVLLYFIHSVLSGLLPGPWFSLLLSILVSAVFVAVIARAEQQEWKSLPLPWKRKSRSGR